MTIQSGARRSGLAGCAAVAATALLTLVGCASAPPPAASLQAAERAIASAEQARAP